MPEAGVNSSQSRSLSQLAIWFLSYCPALGGTATYQARHMQYLASIGARVSFVDEELAPTCSQIHREGLKNINLHEVPLWTRTISSYGRLLALFREERPDIIMLSNFGLLIKLFPLLLWLKLSSKAAIVQTLHSRTFYFSFKNLGMELAASVAMLLCNRIICVSKFTRRDWRRRYPWLWLSRMRVVLNGAASRNLPQRLPYSPLRIGFAGRLSREKDPELFCRVAELSRKLGRPWEFHLYGEGVLQAALQARHRNWVHFHGPEPVRRILFGAMDLLLITSRIENAPFALLEAKSLGVPCVAPAVGGIPEYVLEGVDGMLAGKRSAESLLEALDRAAAAIEKLKQGALERARFFEFSSSVEALWQAVRS